MHNAFLQHNGKMVNLHNGKFAHNDVVDSQFAHNDNTVTADNGDGEPSYYDALLTMGMVSQATVMLC